MAAHDPHRVCAGHSLDPQRARRLRSVTIDGHHCDAYLCDAASPSPSVTPRHPPWCHPPQWIVHAKLLQDRRGQHARQLAVVDLGAVQDQADVSRETEITMTTPTIHTSVQRDVLDNATLRLAFDQPDYRLPAWVQEASTKSDNGKSAVRLI